MRQSERGAALLRRRPKGLLPAARQELLDPSKAWWGGRRGRLADRPRYSISVSLGVVPRWYSRVVEVPVRIEVAAGFVAPGASEPPRLQPSWPPGGSRPAHGLGTPVPGRAKQRRGRLADRPRYSISVSLGVVPRWYSRVVEVPVRIEVAAGFVAPGASEPPRLQPSWPPGGSRPAHG